MIEQHDPSYSPLEPLEASDIPDCSHCADSGIHENFVGERDFCDCAAGCAAEENHDDEMDYEGGLFEDDGDALSSAGMGTDEDYGVW